MAEYKKAPNRREADTLKTFMKSHKYISYTVVLDLAFAIITAAFFNEEPHFISNLVSQANYDRVKLYVLVSASIFYFGWCHFSLHYLETRIKIITNENEKLKQNNTDNDNIWLVMPSSDYTNTVVGPARLYGTISAKVIYDSHGNPVSPQGQKQPHPRA